MATSSSAGPDGKGSSAKRLLPEVNGDFSDAKLIAYWEGRLTDDATREIYAEILRNPSLRVRLTKIVEDLFDDAPQDGWEACFIPASPDLGSQTGQAKNPPRRSQPLPSDALSLLASDSQKGPRLL